MTTVEASRRREPDELAKIGFVSNNLIGWIGGFYEQMSPAAFWAMHAAIAAGGGLLVVLFGRRLGRVLQSTV